MKRALPSWLTPRIALATTGALAAAVACWVALHRPAPRGAIASGDTPPVPIITAREADRFVGSEVCASCHQSEAADHARSLHSHTLASLETTDAFRRVRFDQPIRDEALGVTYTWRKYGETPVCQVYRDRDGASEEMTPRYVVGSGHHGYTFLFEKKGVFMESRLSYYPAAGRWVWTPGQEEQTPFRAPMGRVLSAGVAFSCFVCHSTNLVHKGEQALPEQSRFNVGCERCHGPGRDHVAAARKRNGKPTGVWRYGGVSADTVMRLCGECHRQPGAIPADQLDTAPEVARFAGTALAASKCYQRSQGRLSCLSCHNPHQTVSTDHAAYDRVCRSCHTGKAEKQKVCPVNQTSGCASCHMPARHMPDPQEVKFHSHYIKAYRKATKDQAAAGAVKDLETLRRMAEAQR